MRIYRLNFKSRDDALQGRKLQNARQTRKSFRVSPCPGQRCQGGEQRSEPFLRFDPAAAVGFKDGDTRAFPNIPIPGDVRLASALIFLYPDQTQMALFEIAAKAD